MNSFFMENKNIYIYDSNKDSWIQLVDVTPMKMGNLKSYKPGDIEFLATKYEFTNTQSNTLTLDNYYHESREKPISYSTDKLENTNIPPYNNIYISFLSNDSTEMFIPDNIINNLEIEQRNNGEIIIVLDDFDLYITDSDNIKLWFRKTEILLLYNANKKAYNDDIIKCFAAIHKLILYKILIEKGIFSCIFDDNTEIYFNDNFETTFCDITVHYYIDNKLHKLTLPLSELKILD